MAIEDNTSAVFGLNHPFNVGLGVPIARQSDDAQGTLAFFFREMQTKDGKPGLKLLDVDDERFLKITGIDGQPLYSKVTITPHGPSSGQPSLYDHLINNGGWFAGSSITVLGVDSLMMVRNAYKNALATPENREKRARITSALLDALPTIWARTNPGGEN